MKPSAIVTAALLAVGVPAAQAGLVLLPNLYAREYCNLRDLGVSSEVAMSAAIREASIEGTPIKVTINGRETDLDVIKASQAVVDRCPHHL